MHRHTHRLAIAVLALLAIALLTVPATAAPADVDTTGEAAWSQGVTAWFAGLVHRLTDVGLLPWTGSDGDVERVTANSHPTMDPNGVFLSDPDGQPLTEPPTEPEPDPEP